MPLEDSGIHPPPHALQEGIQTAKSTIDIAALYIGIEGKLETDFIEAIRAAMADPHRPNLKLRILLDASRATRPCKSREGQHGCPYSSSMMLVKHCWMTESV